MPHLLVDTHNFKLGMHQWCSALVSGLVTNYGEGGYSLLIWVYEPPQVVFSHISIAWLWENQKETFEL